MQAKKKSREQYRPTLHTIRKGDSYSGQCSTHGVILRHASCDGLRIATPEGDVIVPVGEIRALLGEIGFSVSMRKDGKSKR